ncbi:MAG: type II/IV secretion system ATPase subunit [Candidatus Bathyarchaeota archaeon]|nr:type II/IV secretion system ATPase subunit [Candidatus Bathyarchaeota archaeon]
MVFNKQLGKLFNRKKIAETPPQQNRVADSALTTDLQSPTPQLGIEISKEASASSNVTVLEVYSVNPPYANVKITRDNEHGTTTYVAEEPVLTETEAALLQRLKRILNEVLDLKKTDLQSKQDAEKYLVTKCAEILQDYGFPEDKSLREKLLYYIVRDNLGYGKIDVLMHDQLIEDISCDGVNVPLFIWHRKFESIPTNIRFETNQELDTFALRLAYLCGSHVSVAQPLLDASMPDGSRINLTYGSEVTRKGSTFTIRKFKLDPFTITDLVAYNTLSAEMAAFFWYAVENRVSILVAGGIAAGKTTLLNCLSMFIKPDLKLVSIEDTPELNLPHENWIPAVARTHFGLSTENADVSLFDLLKASLRQRPDYIIVGEIRGAEAYTLFQAVSTGHLGMSTVHAESVESTVYRLESAPMNIPRTLIAGIDIILVQKRVEIAGKPARKTVSTSEIVGLDPRSGEILTNEVYKYNPLTDRFDYTGRSYIVEKIAEKTGITPEQAIEEIQNRKKIIEWMVRKDIRNYKLVSNIIRGYLEKPESILKEALSNE